MLALPFFSITTLGITRGSSLCLTWKGFGYVMPHWLIGAGLRFIALCHDVHGGCAAAKPASATLAATETDIPVGGNFRTSLRICLPPSTKIYSLVGHRRMSDKTGLFLSSVFLDRLTPYAFNFFGSCYGRYILSNTPTIWVHEASLFALLAMQIPAGWRLALPAAWLPHVRVDVVPTTTFPCAPSWAWDIFSIHVLLHSFVVCAGTNPPDPTSSKLYSIGGENHPLKLFGGGLSPPPK